MKRGWLVALLALTACRGTIVDASEEEGSTGSVIDPTRGIDPSRRPASCDPDEEPAVVGVPIRILTSRELNNALDELFPTVDLPDQTMQFDGRVEAFVLNARDDVLEDHIHEFRRMAETLAPLLAASLDSVMACGGSESESACTARYIPDLASRAFRRAATTEERDGLLGLYEVGRTESHLDGMSMVFEAVLQSPSFLYVHETPAELLSPHEVAQRMAAMFVRSIPDEVLLQAASDGSLMEPAVRVEQAQRLLDSELGQTALHTFVSEWFEVDRLLDTPAALENPTLVRGFEEETNTFISQWLASDSASYPELLSAPYTYLNQSMSDHYGRPLTGGEDVGGGWHRVEVSDAAGLLTQGSFLSHHESPVHRGLTIRRNLICGTVPGPDDIDITAIPTGETEAERSKTEKRLAHPVCGGCHQLMDPIGLAFDTYDAHGVPRTEDEHGNPVSSDGDLTAVDVADRVSSAAEVGGLLAGSADVRSCVASHLFAWTYARSATNADSCVVERIQGHLAENGDDLRGALVSIVASDHFVRSVGGDQ